MSLQSNRDDNDKNDELLAERVMNVVPGRLSEGKRIEKGRLDQDQYHRWQIHVAGLIT